MQDFLSAAPQLKPSYDNPIFSSYGLLLDLYKAGKIDSKYLFRSDVINKIKNNPLVELASHTFSHYYALEEGQTIDQFETDIFTAKQEAAKAGIDFNSIIFPRNQIPAEYRIVCAKNGFSHIRGNEESFLYCSESSRSLFGYKRFFRLLDCYFNITGHHTYKDPPKNELCDVLASRFFYPYRKTLRFLEPLKMKRIKDDIHYAAKHNEIYHLWWHPHNFGVNTQENIKQLEVICKYFIEMRDKYGMQSWFMNQF